MTGRDRELESVIFRLADGDMSALADFYSICRVPVFAYSLSALRSRHAAEDLSQDLLLEIIRSAPNYKPQGKPMAWVISIAKNLCKMKLREQARYSDLPIEEVFSEHDEGMSPEDRVIIRSVLDILGEREREVVVMHAVMGLKHREIAVIIDCPLSTVLSCYQRAIKKLNRELKGALK